MNILFRIRLTFNHTFIGYKSKDSLRILNPLKENKSHMGGIRILKTMDKAVYKTVLLVIYSYAINTGIKTLKKNLDKSELNVHETIKFLIEMMNFIIQ